jgi:N-acetylglutamate synthase-like GNAT family acetyltransferase
MTCQLRRATLADAPAISDVIIATLRKSNAQDYPPEVIAMVEQSFSAAAVAHLLARRKVYVATEAGQVVGTASLDVDVVRSVFIAPQYQGRGVGRQLMAAIHAAALGAGLLELKVPSSITAQGFYAALGYAKVRDEFHGAERTVVMCKVLTG